MTHHPLLTIRQLIDAQADHQPDHDALLGKDDVRLTYLGLKKEIDLLVARFRQMGIHQQDRVALMLPNGIEMAVTFLATACAAVAAPLNPAYKASEIQYYLSDLSIKTLIVPATVTTEIQELAQSMGIRIIKVKRSDPSMGHLLDLDGESLSVVIPESRAEESSVALLLHTSGTTSRPKIVPLRHKELMISAQNIARSLHLSVTDRCLIIMPLFHVHGLIGGLLSSLISGSAVICSEDFAFVDFFQWVEHYHPTWYTAVPTMHQAILFQAKEDPAVLKSAMFRFIRSCSSFLPPVLFHDMEATFGTPVIEAYGMTEASHQMASNPLPPAVRKPGSVGVPVGVQIAIMGEDGLLLEANEIGEIVIQGRSVMAGYENNEAANTDAFKAGWFRTGDQGYMDDEGYVFITGRIKELINRGGEKISPREVDEVLLAHPAVAQVVTFAMPHPRLGEDVASAVVRQPGFSVSEPDLQKFVAQYLTGFKVPGRIVFVDQLPKGPTGKLQRVGLAEKLGVTMPEPGPIPAEAQVSTPIEASIWQILSSLMGVQEISLTSPIPDLGIDSVVIAMLAARLASEFNTEVKMVDILQAASLRDFGASLEARLGTISNSIPE